MLLLIETPTEIETPFAKLKISPPCLLNKNMLLVFTKKDSLIFHILFMAIKYLKIMLSVYYFTLFIIKGHYFSHGKKGENLFSHYSQCLPKLKDKPPISFDTFLWLVILHNKR